MVWVLFLDLWRNRQNIPNIIKNKKRVLTNKKEYGSIKTTKTKKKNKTTKGGTDQRTVNELPHNLRKLKVYTMKLQEIHL